MEHSLAFARHFARLVWLLLNDGTAFDAQIATLRSLVNASGEGRVRIAAADWHVIIDGDVLPERFTGAHDLTAQLIGHSVIELTVDQGAAPSDLLLLARILATEPVPGDGGRNVLARLDALDARTVHVKTEMPPVLAAPAARSDAVPAAAPPGIMRETAQMFISPSIALPDRNAPRSPEHDREQTEDDGIVRERDPDALFEVFSATSTAKGSMVKLFQQLDVARGSAQAAAPLDALVKLAVESSSKARHDIVADVFHGIVTREERVTEKTICRQFGMAVRRLATPSVLECLVELLPRRRENYEQYMAVFARTEEAGVEALVEALISAPTIEDRRVYYDSLLRLNTGVRTLVHMLGDSRWYVVRNAAELLGEMRVQEAEPDLTRLLEHRDDRVRTAATAALAKLGPRTAAKEVRGALRDAAPEQRQRAADALVLHRTASSVDSLVRAFDREADARVQMAMLTALGQIGTPAAVEKLSEVARTDRGLLARNLPTPIRVAAVHALGEVKSSLATITLQALLQDKAKAVRGAASWVLLGRRRESGGGEAAAESTTPGGEADEA